MWCGCFIPYDDVVFVDDASQWAVFNSKAIADDYTGSAFKPEEKHSRYVAPSCSSTRPPALQKLFILWCRNKDKLLGIWNILSELVLVM